jgi:hypothetical protein
MNRREKILSDLLFATLIVGGIIMITLSIILMRNYFILKNNEKRIKNKIYPKIQDYKSYLSLINEYLEKSREEIIPPIFVKQKSSPSPLSRPP